MATANSTPRSAAEKLAWYLDHHAHSVWDRFSAEQQEKMVEEDLAAGKSVSLVLVSLITAGMLLAAVTLLAILVQG